MDTEFKIEWLEKKTTSTGKDKLDATLSEGDKQIEKVTIWSDYPGFAELMPGSTVKGTLNPAKDARFGPTLYPPKTPKQAAGANFKAQQIEGAIVRKEASIEKFQGNKEESIKLMAAERDAVLIVTTFYKERLSHDEIIGETEMEAIIKKKIVEWRDWFLSGNFTDVAPF